MPVRLPIRYEFPAHRFGLSLDGVHYEFRLVYRARTASWYLDLWDEQGAALLLGQRLSPGSSPNRGRITDGPPGALFVFGPDPYPRDGIELWYYAAAELVPTDATDVLPVEIA